MTVAIVITSFDLWFEQWTRDLDPFCGQTWPLNGSNTIRQDKWTYIFVHTYIIPIYNLKAEQKIYTYIQIGCSGWVKINGNIYFFFYMLNVPPKFSSKEPLFTYSTNDRDETERNEHLNI